MKIILPLLFITLISCNSEYTISCNLPWESDVFSENIKSWHLSPSKDERITNFYPFINEFYFEKIHKGMTINELKNIIELPNWDFINNYIIFYSYKYRGSIYEINLKLSSDKSIIEDISIKKWKPFYINTDLANYFSVDKDKSISEYRSQNKYLIQDADLKWKEQAGFHLDKNIYTINIGYMYRYEDYAILDINTVGNALILKIQLLEQYSKDAHNNRLPRILKIIPISNTSFLLTGNKCSGVYNAVVR